MPPILVRKLSDDQMLSVLCSRRENVLLRVERVNIVPAKVTGAGTSHHYGRPPPGKKAIGKVNPLVAAKAGALMNLLERCCRCAGRHLWIEAASYQGEQVGALRSTFCHEFSP